MGSAAAPLPNVGGQLFTDLHQQKASAALLDGRQIRVLKRGDAIDVKFQAELNAIERLLLIIQEFLRMVETLNPEELFRQPWSDIEGKIKGATQGLADVHDPAEKLQKIREYRQHYQTYRTAREVLGKMQGFQEGLANIDRLHEGVVAQLNQLGEARGSAEEALFAIAVREAAGNLVSTSSDPSEKLREEIEKTVGMAALNRAYLNALGGMVSTDHAVRLHDEFAPADGDRIRALRQYASSFGGSADQSLVQEIEKTRSKLEELASKSGEKALLATERIAQLNEAVKAAEADVKRYEEYGKVSYPKVPEGHSEIVGWIREFQMDFHLTEEQISRLVLVSYDLKGRVGGNRESDATAQIRGLAESVGFVVPAGQQLTKQQILDILRPVHERASNLIAELQRDDRQFEEVRLAVVEEARGRYDQAKAQLEQQERLLAEKRQPQARSFTHIFHFHQEEMNWKTLEGKVEGLKVGLTMAEGELESAVNSYDPDYERRQESIEAWTGLVGWIDAVHRVMESVDVAQTKKAEAQERLTGLQDERYQVRAAEATLQQVAQYAQDGVDILN